MHLRSNHHSHLPLCEPSPKWKDPFHQLFHQYQGKVYQLALAYLKVPDAAEEILQEVFMKLWSKRAIIQELASPEAWLHTVTKHAILNCMKKRANESIAIKKFAKHLLQTESNTDYKVRNKQYLELVQKAIHQLSIQQKAVYLLAREHELSYEQIGTLLSLSPLTVKTHMSRALHSIRQFCRQRHML